MQIYKITNIINGMFYVGKTTKTLEERWNKHQRYNKAPKLFAAIKKYGVKNFKLETLEFCKSKEELNQREIYWISTLKAIECGYNISKGGDGGVMTGEALEKIRLSAIRRVTKESTKEKYRRRIGSKSPRAEKVVVTLENGVEIGFGCIKDASQFLNIAHSTARALVRGVNKPLRKNIKINYVEVL